MEAGVRHQFADEKQNVVGGSLPFFVGGGEPTPLEQGHPGEVPASADHTSGPEEDEAAELAALGRPRLTRAHLASSRETTRPHPRTC
ncbi:hypothetical protein KCMC57_up10430 [Kitasatospora sp. CMC57]|uniref:Uncharacterized protein n=1 Tax=Kitasatospora sp. CMC57 TaxID=3231513 RepID=A0AB33JTA1_9ACTN